MMWHCNCWSLGWTRTHSHSLMWHWDGGGWFIACAAHQFGSSASGVETFLDTVNFCLVFKVLFLLWVCRTISAGQGLFMFIAAVLLLLDSEELPTMQNSTISLPSTLQYEKAFEMIHWHFHDLYNSKAFDSLSALLTNRLFIVAAHEMTECVEIWWGARAISANRRMESDTVAKSLAIVL